MDLFIASKHVFSDDEGTAAGAGREEKSKNGFSHQQLGSANPGFNIIPLCGPG